MGRISLTRVAGGFGGWIGGGVTRVAATGIVAGSILVISGMSPAEVAAWIWSNPPEWLSSPWLRLGLLIIGMVIIGVSLRFNVWSRKQKAIDDLAEDIQWAIQHLLNCRPDKETNESVSEWEQQYRGWCERVGSKLENRAFFTKADQIHFDSLGFVDPVQMARAEPSENMPPARLDWWLSQLKMKFERLRDIIQWSQQRRR